MTIKPLTLLLATTLFTSVAWGQSLPHKVTNVEVRNLDGRISKLPYFGKKHLMIFYVDPDRHRQNHEFTMELENNGRASSSKIYGFGVMNLADAPFIPNGMARILARRRTEKNGATIMADENCILSSHWNLGDCNNKFVLLFVTKDGELVFMRKGVFSQQDIQAFYDVLDKYK